MTPEMQSSALLAIKNLFLESECTRGRVLGRGSFGVVYEGHSDNGFHFAVKEVSLLDGGSHAKKCVDQLQQEITLLSQLEHKNIVQYYGSHRDKVRLCMFMELVPDGSLERRLDEKNPLSISLASKYTEDILHGLKYLHDHNVIHRDIKCANILVDAQGSAKLADFGVAKIIKMNDIKSLQGTAFWMAPEVVTASKDSKDYGLPADIWSLGCSVLEMLNGLVPCPKLEQQQALFRILEGKFPVIPDSLPVDAKDFIQKCLQVDPNNRPTAAELLNHPFVKVDPSGGSGFAMRYPLRKGGYPDYRYRLDNPSGGSGFAMPLSPQAIFGFERNSTFSLRWCNVHSSRHLR